MNLELVRATIKQWEKLFYKKHGRNPEKLDIKQDATVRKLYKAYSEMKHGTPEKKPSKEPEILQDELGPTPQANGRVLSLFNITMTPPRTTQKPTLEADQTPTRPLRNTVMARLLEVSLPSKTMLPPKSSPSKLFSPTKGTPSYMKHIELTPTKPSLGPLNFSVSPSPLKPHRFMTRLTQVFEEATLAVIPELKDGDGNVLKMESDQEEEEDEEPATEGSPVKRKRAQTQKRTTRNWRIKPRGMAETGASLDGKDIHAELDRIKESTKEVEVKTEDILRQKRKLNTQVDALDKEELELEDEFEYKRPAPVKNGVAPVSRNYQRLKINDPRTARFKRRMRR